MHKFIYIFILLSMFVYAEEKVVKVATEEDYAPFCFTNGKYKILQTIEPSEDAENFRGYSWDVLKESYHVMGYTIKLLISPWARSMKSLKNGKVDVLFPAGINDERKKIFDYSKESINEANFLIYVNLDNPIKWQDLKSLDGKIVGAKRGYNYGNLWNNNKNIYKHDVNSVVQGFRMLEAKRFDGLVGYEYNWDYILKQQGWKDKFKKLPIFDSSAEHLISLKNNPNGKKLLEIFDLGKKELKKNGKLEEIKKKWFGD